MTFDNTHNLPRVVHKSGLLAIILFAVSLSSVFCLAQSHKTDKQAKGTQSASKAISASKSATNAQKLNSITNDAVIFVRPGYPDSANIGIAYSTRVDHATVKADVDRLLAAGQWQLAGPLEIADTSVHSDRMKEFPPTTGVLFRVNHAPHVVEKTLVLLPYLKAFQRLNQIELDFSLEALHPYRGITKVENNVISIQMLQSDGLYSFQVTYRSHKETIPALVNSGKGIDQSFDQTQERAQVATFSITREENFDANSRKSAPHSPNMLLIIALALGTGTLVGGSVYVVMSRQPIR